MKIPIALLVALTASISIGSEPMADIAAHHPGVQKAKRDYRTAEGGEAYKAAWNTVLNLQKKHRKIYDAIRLGDSVFLHEGLLTLGEIRFQKKDGYALTFGIKPRDVGEEISELIIVFDEEGLITKKSLPRYTW